MWRSMLSGFLLQPPAVCLLILFLLSIFLKQEVADAIIAKPGCKDRCGNVSIPFPFGIGPNHNCFQNDWFEINCSTSRNSNGSTSTKPFLSKFDIEVMEVSLFVPDELPKFAVKVRIPPLNSCHVETHQQLSGINFSGSPYQFSWTYNTFIMKGCPGNGVLVNPNNVILTGCSTVCDKGSYNNTALQINSCNGVDCCQTRWISQDSSRLQFYHINFSQQASSGEGHSCLEATIIYFEEMNQYYVGNLSSLHRPSGSPVMLRWQLERELLHEKISPHAICHYIDVRLAPACSCKEGYYGNPYISNGCQIPQECMSCQGYCLGEWDMEGRLTPGTFYCEKKPMLKLPAILGLSIGFGILLLVIGLYWLCVKRSREMNERSKFFKRNGGLLLQQHLSSSEGVVERTRIFSIAELERATDHFNENQILGQGGQGTVYKGMLADGRIVAIKKSKVLDGTQLEQFINEVVILSQINHRNVVKLLGCCLETEVPLLIYEFIPNGTLSEHIHDHDEDFIMSWEMLLKVVVDSASAVAYLHSSSSIPIYHRDIKPSNILLDEKHRAKVSDFGSSKTFEIDETHKTTLVQGTIGYLDPEYFHTNQFTEKSDVYSFGVVLLELLTRKKPIYRDTSTMEQKNLVAEFLFLSQQSRLFEILDTKFVNEAREEELMAVAELAKCCIHWSGKLRPTMKEVATTLETIMKSVAQVSRQYQEQAAFPSPDVGFDDYVVANISDTELMWSTLPTDAGAGIPVYTDVHPLMPNTV